MAFWDDKVYTGMNFVSLVPPDISLRAAKKQIIYSSKADLGEYNKTYFQWKKNYRNRYSETKLEKMGYEPYVYGNNVSEEPDEMALYMQGIDPDYHHTINFNTGVASLYTQLVSFMQNNGYDYSIKEKKLNTGGDTFRYSHTTYLENDDPTIPDNKTIIVGHFREGSSDVFHTVEIPNLFGKEQTFENTYTRDEVESEYYIYLRFKNEVPNYIYNSEEYKLTPIIMLKEYGTLAENSKDHVRMMKEIGVSPQDFEETLSEVDDDGEPAIDNAYLLNGLPTLNPYLIESRKYESWEAQELPAAFLEKINANSEEDVFPTQEEVEWWYNNHTNEQAYLARGLFKTFAYYAGAMDIDVLNNEKFSLIYIGDSVADRTSENAEEVPVNFYEKIIKTDHPWKVSDADITIESGGLKMRYGYDISVVTKPGRARPEVIDKRSQANFHYSGRMHTMKNPNDDGDVDYWTADHEGLGYDRLVIKVQKTADTYQEMTITNYRADYDLGSEGFAVGAGAPASMNRVILPYFIVKDVKFREFVTISDHSFIVFAYMIKIVEFNWTSFFVELAVTLVVCFITLGTGCSFIMVALKFVITKVVMYALGKLLKKLDIQILILIFEIAFSVYQMLNGNPMSMADMPIENYLKIATQISNIVMNVQQILEIKNMGDNDETEAKLSIDEKVESVDNAMHVTVTANMSAHYSFKDGNSPDAFYAAMYGEALFNYEQFYNVDKEIELRKQVTSG